MPPRKKKVVTEEPLQTPPPPTRKRNGQAAWLVIVGLLLAVLVGGAIFLMSQQPPAPNEPVANANTNTPPANTNTNTPPVVDVPPVDESGSVELVNVMDADNVVITDQKIVWRSADKPDAVLVDSVNALIPGLVSSRSALYLFAKPTNSDRVYYGISCNGPCDAGLRDMISFDPKRKSFIPLVNAPDIQLNATHLSGNQHRLAYIAGIDEDGEARELWVYDLTADTRTKVITLPSAESLTKALLEFDGSPLVDVVWKDPTMVSYSVFRAGGRIPGTDRPRTVIATRTANLEPIAPQAE